MKPIKTTRKLQLSRESLRQMTPRALPAADLARVVGGTGEDGLEAWPTLRCEWLCHCYMTSV